jgi:hypothetical protein
VRRRAEAEIDQGPADGREEIVDLFRTAEPGLEGATRLPFGVMNPSRSVPQKYPWPHLKYIPEKSRALLGPSFISFVRCIL